MSSECLFAAPTTGCVIMMEEVNDPVFSQKMMGDGFAIIPQGNVVCSPISGEIVMLYPTFHAIGIKDAKGNEILLHLGLQSYSLKGNGLHSTLTIGQSVTVGEPLLMYELPVFQSKGIDPTLIIIFLNGQTVQLSEMHTQVECGQLLRLQVTYE